MLYSFFWVIPRRLNVLCRRFGTLWSSFIGRVNKTYENETEYSETSAQEIQMPGNHQKERIQGVNVKNPRCRGLNTSTDLDIIFVPCITVARAACDSATRLPVFTILLHRYFARLPYHHYHQRLGHQHRYHQEPWIIRHDFLFQNHVGVKTVACWHVTPFSLVYVVYVYWPTDNLLPPPSEKNKKPRGGN
jgi:hypothetical protein